MKCFPSEPLLCMTCATYQPYSRIAAICLRQHRCDGELGTRPIRQVLTSPAGSRPARWVLRYPVGIFFYTPTQRTVTSLPITERTSTVFAQIWEYPTKFSFWGSPFQINLKERKKAAYVIPRLIYLSLNRIWRVRSRGSSTSVPVIRSEEVVVYLHRQLWRCV